MSTAILYINDNDLVLRQGQQESRSQGYAWLKDEDVYFDTHPELNAVKHCRLAPQQSNNRYWMQCDQSSIPTNGAGMRHTADLIWRHLSELAQQHQLTDLALVVPSHYQPQHLELLLGVAHACNLNITGVVNSSVLALHDKVASDGIYRHVDVQLQQTVCSEVLVANGIAKLASVDIVHDVSLQAMQDALLRAMQHNFIQSDRFDPLHDAGTEQQLFDQIVNVAKAINADGKANILVEHLGRSHSSNLDKANWNKALAPFIATISKAIGLDSSAANAEQSFVQLNHVFGNAVPEQLANLGCRLVHSDDLAIPPSKALTAEADSELIYLNELAITAATVAPKKNIQPPAPDTQVNNSSAGTQYLLLSGIAVPIAQAQVTISNNQLGLGKAEQGNAQAMLQSGELFVMSEPERKQMLLNDRLGSQIADGVITVIEVV